MSKLTIYNMDVREALGMMGSGTVHLAITSPPYYNLRNYGSWEGQIGLESSPREYVRNLVEAFRELRRVLRDDGTFRLNLGDGYATKNYGAEWIKNGDLLGIPWDVAFALREDGWYLREDIVWAKPSPLPNGRARRCVKSHEYLFTLCKQRDYYYDIDAISEPSSNPLKNKMKRDVWTIASQPYKGAHMATFPEKLVEPCILSGTSDEGCCSLCGVQMERVVEIVPSVAKYSTQYKKEIGENALVNNTNRSGFSGGETRTLGWRAGCSCVGGDLRPSVVLDPFGGSGTTAKVALGLGRDAVVCELNSDYVPLIMERCDGLADEVEVVRG